MQIGLIGCGNMARALARGWGRPLLCADPVADRASALAAEVGGEALATNAEVAERAELVVLCHKPAQLEDVAREIAPGARAVASILAAVPLEALRDAYPERPVYRFIPSLPVEVRQGAVVQAADPFSASEGAGQDAAIDAAVSELFAELGTLVVLPDALLDVAMASCPAHPRMWRWWPKPRWTPACAGESQPPRVPSSWCRRWRERPSCFAVAVTTWWPSAARSPPREDSRHGASTPSSARAEVGVQRGAGCRPLR